MISPGMSFDAKCGSGVEERAKVDGWGGYSEDLRRCQLMRLRE
jgi:hypothetical protein